jgi:iron-sulfur cluster assembly protein
MLHISDTAKLELGTLMSSQGLGEEAFVRVSVVAGGCSGLAYDMKFDTESRDDDEVFEDNGMKVVTDARSVLYLFGTTLDYTGGLEGKGFFFSNPNASRTCGCGESFAV